MTKEQKSLQKFQALLRELFQFDRADLNFGVYRIMNLKRDAFKRFVEDDLPEMAAAVLSADQKNEINRVIDDLAGAREEVEKTAKNLGIAPFDDGDNLTAGLTNTPLGKKYQRLARKAGGGKMQNPANLRAESYNYLYEFFSRYYADGDFLSQRHYGARARYAVPYKGEEVFLHWANRDQYYVKTTELFSRYAFRAPGGYRFRFAVHTADLENDNNKGAARHYFPLLHKSADTDGEILIPFEYRPPTDGEKSEYGANVQDGVIERAASDLTRAKLDNAAKAALAAASGESAESQSVLTHHLHCFVRRNTTDYFIHKNLRGFLRGELDYYCQSEVLNVEELTAGGDIAMEQRFAVFRAVRELGQAIVDFIAQIEDLQKRLWEKRKFVTATEYCVSIDQIRDDKLLHSVLSCDAQWNEWRQLLGEAAMSEGDKSLFAGNNKKARRTRFLRENPTLTVDTRHFGEEFKDELLATFDDIDAVCGGLLIHGENWQALNLLREKYREQVQCVYIDPPYNTSASEILYKNGYKHSSWLSLMADRVLLNKTLLSDKGVQITAIDDTEFVALAQMFDALFSEYDRKTIVVNHHPGGAGLEGTNISETHEYAIFLTPAGEKILHGQVRERNSDDVETIGFMRGGAAISNTRAGRPNSFYAVLVNPKSSTVVGLEPPPQGDKYPMGNTIDGFVRIYPLRSDGSEMVWRRSYESCLKEIANNKIICKNGTSLHLVQKEGIRYLPIFSNWTDSKYNAGRHGTELLRNILGGNFFSYPKSVHSVADCVNSATRIYNSGIVLDYFAGSGTTAHAVINLNREDGGGRKFILVEMGDYFHTVLLPRIKKIIYTPEWKDGKPRRPPTADEIARTPRMLKYHQLESYDDAMENIAFADEQGNLSFDEYRLQYRLQWETKHCATFLATEKLQTPFDYRLQKGNGNDGELAADLPETFNYLLGLNVQKRRVFMRGKKRYLVYIGLAAGQKTAIIWRNTKDWTPKDFELDREFVKKEIIGKGKIAAAAEKIFVNDDSIIRGAESLDPAFKAGMFGGN